MRGRFTDWAKPLMVMLLCIRLFGQSAGSGPSVDLSRRYQTGETLRYEMKGSNDGWEYQVQANVVVKRDQAGIPYEEIAWSGLKSNAPMTLSPESIAFRQTLSLAPENKYLAVPDLSKVQPFLIGPITDLLTFYSDLFLASHLKLTAVGQHLYFEHGTPNSWADGQHVILGQDSIDFDLTMTGETESRHTATLLIKHVPPRHPQVKLPAQWMETPVGDTPNNFVQVVKQNGNYLAQVGQERFSVTLNVDTRSGKILTVQLHNPLTTILRTCQDAALLNCGAATPGTTLREVNLSLIQ